MTPARCETPKRVSLETNSKNHGREINEKVSWSSNHWKRNHRDGIGRHLGGIWEASGKHQGSIWEASGRHLWEASGGGIWDSGCLWEASGRHQGSIWEAFGRHLWVASRIRELLGAIWEASGKHLGLQEAMGLQEALGSNYCNTSQLKCKSSFKMSILRGVFEGRCHQVMQITIQNAPRQRARV